MAAEREARACLGEMTRRGGGSSLFYRRRAAEGDKEQRWCGDRAWPWQRRCDAMGPWAMASTVAVVMH
ncbi:hypothetical protein E2562_028434 [Oryza meyeriana var. granulata]|uniref:Uncharacterized protein n=1 Tax=Oryza meyeriana var. granulata TaxID=110450 RepID=A0A6G1E2W8_9ORYZ|nr:hypothetical protein E2562_028434 [Oryza meyeriana var. granulata]